MHTHLDWLDTDIPIFLSPRRPQDVLKTCGQDIMKRCLEDVLKTCLEDILKTSSA